MLLCSLFWKHSDTKTGLVINKNIVDAKLTLGARACCAPAWNRIIEPEYQSPEFRPVVLWGHACLYRRGVETPKHNNMENHCQECVCTSHARDDKWTCLQKWRVSRHALPLLFIRQGLFSSSAATPIPRRVRQSLHGCGGDYTTTRGMHAWDRERGVWYLSAGGQVWLMAITFMWQISLEDGWRRLRLWHCGKMIVFFTTPFRARVTVRRWYKWVMQVYQTIFFILSFW